MRGDVLRCTGIAGIMKDRPIVRIDSMGFVRALAGGDHSRRAAYHSRALTYSCQVESLYCMIATLRYW